MSDIATTAADSVPTAPPSASRLVISLRDRLSFAAYQNDVPVLAELKVENPTDRDQSDLTLSLTCEPALLRPRTWKLDRVRAGEEVSLRDLKVDLVGAELAGLRERRRADATFTLTDHGGRLLAASVQRVVGLARNEWGGGEHEMPELLGAFVMPNDPAVGRLLRDAAGVLERAGQPKRFDGYQSKDRERVWQMVSAVWSAVKARKLVYAEPPASFEDHGQKIRTPSEAWDTQLATCLEPVMHFVPASRGPRAGGRA